MKKKRDASLKSRFFTLSKYTTPWEELQAQIFSGTDNNNATSTIDGTLPCLLEFGYEKASKVFDSIDGVQSYHDFEFTSDGGIRAWKSYGIGEGRLFSKHYLDSLYTDKTPSKRMDMDPLGENVFPQQSTDVKITPGLDLSDHKPKFEKLKNVKRKEREEHEQNKNEKKARKENECRSQIEAFNIKTGENFEYKSEEMLKEEKNNLFSNMAEAQQSNVRKGETVNGDTSQVLMGMGLVLYKDTTEIDVVTRQLIQYGVQLGVENPSNRQSIFEILELCERSMPLFLQPDYYAVSSCVKTLLKEKETNKSNVDSSKVKASKTMAEKRQRSANTLQKSHSDKLGNKDKYHLFSAKYLNVLLLYQEKIRMITDVKFADAVNGVDVKNSNSRLKKCWYVETKEASARLADRKRYVVLNGEENPLLFKIGKTKLSLSRLIKAFNEKKL